MEWIIGGFANKDNRKTVLSKAHEIKIQPELIA
jgi:hypothetical protein